MRERCSVEIGDQHHGACSETRERRLTPHACSEQAQITAAGATRRSRFARTEAGVSAITPSAHAGRPEQARVDGLLRRLLLAQSDITIDPR